MGQTDPSAAVLRNLEAQAAICDALGSPFSAKVCRALAEGLDHSTATGRRALGWPGNATADALALRLLGALHGLVLRGADEGLVAVYPPREVADSRLRDAITTAIRQHDEGLCRALDSVPQTNEVARSAMLLPGFLSIARETGVPLEIAEIGASAGLNLNFDRFHYRYGTAQWGSSASPVRLAPELRGNVPPLDGALTVSARSGCDIAPVDLSNDAARLRLRSFIWADQATRLQRLDAATGLAVAAPVTLVQADAADFLLQKLAARSEGSVFVMFHSAVWDYMPHPTRDAIEVAIRQAGTVATERSPLAWLSVEPLAAGAPHAVLRLTIWPRGETRQLAACDHHGRWIEWL
jgi:hypothetical protein